jgi:hypothetical protein
MIWLNLLQRGAVTSKVAPTLAAIMDARGIAAAT